MQVLRTLLKRIPHKYRAMQCHVSKSLLTSIFEASVAAWRIGSKDELQQVVERNLSLADVPRWIAFDAVYLWSKGLRLRGRFKESNKFLELSAKRLSIPVDKSTVTFTDARAHYFYGLMLISKSENDLQCHRFDKAISRLSNWTAADIHSNPRTLHFTISRQKSTVIGRILRYQGIFPESEECLTKCWDCCRLLSNTSTRCHILHHLADVLCENKKYKEALIYLTKDMSELEHEEKTAHQSYRRLLVSMVECNVMLGQLSEAESKCLRIHEQLKDLSLDPLCGQMDDFRVTISLIRINVMRASYNEALFWSKTARGQIERHSTFEIYGFYSRVLWLFQCIIESELGNEAEVQLALGEAAKCQIVRQHYIPGLGTYVYDWVLLRLRERNIYISD